jgi:SAM-dependent methyltransferase
MADGSSQGGPTPPNNIAATLAAKFQDQPLSSHPTHWDSLWRSQTTPWDRGGSSVALQDAIAEHPALFDRSPAAAASDPPRPPRRKRALVPGCGRGYDVLLLASLGYDAYGLDSSGTAIAAAKRHAAENPLPSPSSAEEGTTPGAAEFLEGDFWSDAWLARTATGLPPSSKEEGQDPRAFDLIFDYTFLCALPPSARGAWAARMKSLLLPRGGRLVCLEFPLHKPAGAGGPPFGLSEEIYVGLLTGTETDGAGEGAGPGLTRLGRWRPRRSHEGQQGKDYVSVWGYA